MRRISKLLITVVLAILISACARSPEPKVDPYESFNRTMFKINTFVDKVAIKPAATLYSKLTPRPLQTGVSNVIDNVGEVSSMANDLLQLKLRYFFVNFWRFLINSTAGVGGLFDVASKVGLPKHNETLVLTFAYWSHGKKSSYLMLPFWGPTTLRGAVALPFEYYMSPLAYVRPKSIYYIFIAGQLISYRAELLPADYLVDTAFDPYIFVRNAYLQRHNQAVAKNQAEPHS